MTHLSYGIVAGAVLGAVAVAPMFRMSFPDKRAAISAAFIERFMLGVVIGLVALPWPSWATGLAFGVLLSLPSAIILPKARIPILVVGTVGGLIIGLLLPIAVRP